ncbi:MAG: hypothetical protein WD061_00445 [Candidatus Saccharimonadales bacterium]
MSDTDEPYIAPEASVVPEASSEVVKETYDPPTASIESIKASEPPRASTEMVRNDPLQPSPPEPSVEYEKKGIDPGSLRKG